MVTGHRCPAVHEAEVTALGYSVRPQGRKAAPTKPCLLFFLHVTFTNLTMAPRATGAEQVLSKGVPSQSRNSSDPLRMGLHIPVDPTQNIPVN